MRPAFRRPIIIQPSNPGPPRPRPDPSPPPPGRGRARSNAEIGQILDIKLATVKTHVSHILQKLGVKRRSEAKTVAQQRGLSPGNGI